MDTTEAFQVLNLPPDASEQEIRRKWFREYQALSAALLELDDERQRPLLEARLARLNEARDVLLGNGSQAETGLSGVSSEELPPK
jgi:curved DNA-binding protein CbpA